MASFYVDNAPWRTICLIVGYPNGINCRDRLGCSRGRHINMAPHYTFFDIQCLNPCVALDNKPLSFSHVSGGATVNYPVPWFCRVLSYAHLFLFPTASLNSLMRFIRLSLSRDDGGQSSGFLPSCIHFPSVRKTK